MDIVEKVKDHILTHCETKSMALNVPKTQMSVRFSLAPQNDSVVYATCKNFAKVEDTNLKEIMRLRLDLLGQANQAESYIYAGLNHLCQKHGIEIVRIYVFAVPDDRYETVDDENERNVKERVAVYVYNAGDFVEKISVGDFASGGVEFIMAMQGQQK